MFYSARKLTLLMLTKNPEHRIQISQILQNEFVTTSTIYTSEPVPSLLSNNKIKSNSNFSENNSNSISPDPSNNNNQSSNKKYTSTNQNKLQLPLNLISSQSQSGNNSLNNMISEQNCIKSVNSIFIGSSKGVFDNISSYMSEQFSPSHFTNSDHAKKSSKTYTSNIFSLNHTNTLNRKSVINLMTNKTGKSEDDYSYFVKSEIFLDENPVIELLLELEIFTSKRPHPSKKF